MLPELLLEDGAEEEPSTTPAAIGPVPCVPRPTASPSTRILFLRVHSGAAVVDGSLLCVRAREDETFRASVRTYLDPRAKRSLPDVPVPLGRPRENDRRRSTAPASAAYPPACSCHRPSVIRVACAVDRRLGRLPLRSLRRARHALATHGIKHVGFVTLAPWELASSSFPCRRGVLPADDEPVFVIIAQAVVRALASSVAGGGQAPDGTVLTNVRLQ